MAGAKSSSSGTGDDCNREQYHCNQLLAPQLSSFAPRLGVIYHADGNKKK
jgi:hypothetical protein